jgi:hypothetical protein
MHATILASVPATGNTWCTHRFRTTERTEEEIAGDGVIGS